MKLFSLICVKFTFNFEEIKNIRRKIECCLNQIKMNDLYYLGYMVNDNGINYTLKQHEE